MSAFLTWRGRVGSVRYRRARSVFVVADGTDGLHGVDAFFHGMEQGGFQSRFRGFPARGSVSARVQIGGRIERYFRRHGMNRRYRQFCRYRRENRFRHIAFQNRAISCHERSGSQMERINMGTGGGQHLRRGELRSEGAFPGMDRECLMWAGLVPVSERSLQRHIGPERMLIRLDPFFGLTSPVFPISLAY